MLGPLAYLEIAFLIVVCFIATWLLITRAYPLRRRPGRTRVLVVIMRIGAGVSMSLFFLLFLLGINAATIGLNVMTEIANNPWSSNLVILVELLAFGQVISWLMWTGMSDTGRTTRS